MNDIKNWIKDNLQYSRGLICKKCKKEWFEKYNFLDKWQEIYSTTSFLDSLSPSFPQRVWHIIFDQPLIKCANPSCQNIPKFWSFNEGYLDTCSASCAQYNPKTQEKIKNTNLQKYGTEHALQNENIKEKQSNTMMVKYGIKNISQAKGISEKKQQTCLKNYGTKWFLQRTDLIKHYVKEKYGVENIQQLKTISNETSITRKSVFYESLFTTTRLNGVAIPLFTKQEYLSGGLYKKYSFECNKCKTQFEDCLEDGDVPRCPTCYKNSSIFEKEITEYIKSLLPNDIIEENNRTVLNNKELDIYIPSKNLAIECNGLFWHGEVGGNKDKNYHLNKTMECESKDIRLVHIFEDEWIINKNIVKNRLSYMLNTNSINSIFARNCDVKEISTNDKNVFLIENHLQGNDNSKIRLGLFYNNELIAVMTFGNKRIFMNSSSTEGEYELMRYATSKTVVGGAGKLLSYFIKTYNPTKIISYADRRWSYSKSNLYERIGFKKISNGTPNYWYFGRDGNYRRFHRFGFAKHTLVKRLASFDPNLTEWENMKNNGWDRIWDCGSIKYELIIKS